MSLATRCPSCGTAFRVVQDQLKVSDGWVRCGRCSDIFNAIEGLFDMDAAEAQSGGKPSAAPGTAAAPTTPSAAAVQHTPEPLAHLLKRESGRTGDDAAATAADVLDSGFLRRSTYALQPEQAGRFDDGFADARYDSSLEGLEFEGENSDGAGRAQASAGKAGGKRSWRSGRAATSQDAGADSEAPEFLRKAEREARWRTPGVRTALAALLLLLTATLAAQVALQQRDWLAAYHPETRPVLEQLCGWTGCTVGPLRRIEDVVLDSSSLSPADTPDTYRLSLLLRNRGDVTLALPAIELSLTDNAGQLVARRVLLPADFGAADAIEARSDVALSLELATPGRPVTGFTVEAFHP